MSCGATGWIKLACGLLVLDSNKTLWELSSTIFILLPDFPEVITQTMIAR